VRRFIVTLLAASCLAAPALAQNIPTTTAAPAAPMTEHHFQRPMFGPGPAMGPWYHDGGRMHDHHHGMRGMQMIGVAFLKFQRANTSHDGHLTLAQAQQAHWMDVVAHFAAIDTAKRGYVTFNDIIAWHADQMAHKLEAFATNLRQADR
jgi:hypothetical protein